MKKILKLTYVLKKAEGTVSTSGFYLALLVLGSAAFGFFGLIYSEFVSALGDPASICPVLYLTAATMGIVLSFPHMLNQLYMSPDSALLMTMPISVPQLLAAKLLSAGDILFIAAFVFTIPFGITSGISCGMGISYYLASVLAFFCIPLVSGGIMTIILMIVMYFVKGIRNTDIWKVFGTVFAVIFIVAEVIFLNNKEKFGSILNAAVDIVKGWTWILPVNITLKALLNGNLVVGLFGTLAMTAVIVGIFVVLANKIYLQAALSMNEGSNGNGALQLRDLKKTGTKSTILQAFTRKEFLTVARNPAFLLQGFIYPLFYPALMLFLLVFKKEASEVFGIASITTPQTALSWCIFMTALITACSGFMNLIAKSSFSREGESAMFLRQIPVDAKTIVSSKFNVALIVSVIGSTSYVLIGGLILTISGIIPFWCVLISLILNILLLLYSVSLCMMGDIKKPVLDWENETAMIKKCSNSKVVILIIAILVVGMAFHMCNLLIPELTVITSSAVMIISALLALFETRRLYKVGVEKVKEL